MIRMPGWEDRLNAVVQFAHTRQFKLGEWDCLRFACAACEAVTGVDYWPRFAGYETEIEYLRKIKKLAKSYDDAITLVTGITPCLPTMARRGDVVTYRGEDGKVCLGVSVGPSVLMLTETGVTEIEITSPALINAWRLG